VSGAARVYVLVDDGMSLLSMRNFLFFLKGLEVLLEVLWGQQEGKYAGLLLLIVG
jgi:hypothetical protein